VSEELKSRSQMQRAEVQSPGALIAEIERLRRALQAIVELCLTPAVCEIPEHKIARAALEGK
jgi:hypothetical protein